MFENLLFQEYVTSTLTREINDGTLPQSLLFYGESFSGKLTAALELARVLNCTEGGQWLCKCKSCSLNLGMDHPYLLLTGTRYFIQEINQSGYFLALERSKAAQYIYIRNVKKLIKRFNEDLWDKEDNKYKKIIPNLNKINDVIHDIEPNQILPKDKKLRAIIKKISTECIKIANELPVGNIPISQIRKISTWVRRSVSNMKKVVILERAELMQEGSRNSLLKILEEPPPDTYFILISKTRGNVLPTILSRVRTYPFKHRSIEEQGLILNKLFKTSNGFETIKEYFFSYSDYEGDSFKNIVSNYWVSLFNRNIGFSDALEGKIEGSYFLPFLEVFTVIIKDDFFGDNSQLSLAQIEEINKDIKDKILKFTDFNQNPMLLLETLFYEIRRIIYA